MGLDNGISVKKKDSIKFKPYILDEYNEVCYWRKCWNIRNEIMSYLCQTYGLTEDNYRWEINVDDVKAIIDILSSFNEKKLAGWWGICFWKYLGVG